MSSNLWSRSKPTDSGIKKISTQQTPTQVSAHPISVNQTPQNMGKKRMLHEITGYSDDKPVQGFSKSFK